MPIIVKADVQGSVQAATDALSSLNSPQILLHKVIYHLLEEMGRLIVEKAPGTAEAQISGEAEVLNIFELKGRSKSKGPDIKIAGCRITDGRFSRSGTMRLLRSGDVVF